MANVILKVVNLTKSYGNKVVVNNLSFSIYESEIFGFLGPNGAGKSTAMKMITGLAKMDSGDVFICKKSIKTQFEQAIVNVGGVIEKPEMYNNMSGLSNLEYYASLYKGIDKDKIISVGKIVGLEDRLKDKVRTYSLGMKQRLGIAQALLHSPKLLILDEPTNGLDPEGVVEMRKFLKKIAIKEKIGIFISSHNLAEMEMLCDTIGIINHGELERVYTIEQMKKIKEKICLKVNFPNFAGKLILKQFGDVKLSILKNTVTVELPQDKTPEITSMLVSNGIKVYSVNVVEQTLEDLFLDTVNKRPIPLKRS